MCVVFIGPNCDLYCICFVWVMYIVLSIFIYHITHVYYVLRFTYYVNSYS